MMLGSSSLASSAVTLFFLLTNSSTSSSGMASKKATISGIWENFSSRDWIRSRIFSLLISGFVIAAST
ncbi:hypothetical protein D3C75_1318000 [compost metagenome]